MKKVRVLVVEDDSWLAEQQKRVLKKAGYRVGISADAISAIEDIDKIKPDAIILDLLLPGNTAYALMNELKSYTDIGSIPIILCTNLASEVSINDVSHYGVRRILDKTVMLPDDVVAAVRSIV